MRLHTPRVTGSFEVSSSVLTVNSSGTISGSATSTGSFGAIRAAGMTVPNLLDFSSSIASRVTTEESDFTAAGISGSWQNVIGSGSLGMVSGSAISTGSFGAVNVAGMSVSNLINVSSSVSSRVNLLEGSGSITESSASFSTRVALLEGSGSITESSASFSTRVTTEEGNVDSLQTDSGSFSTRVTTAEASGALFDGTGAVTFATVDTGQGANVLYDMNQNVKTDSNVTFGNVTATGTVTAEEFHTEFVSASIHYVSGSTKFGDTSDDVHSFTGSLVVTGSVGIGTTDMTTYTAKLYVKDNPSNLRFILHNSAGSGQRWELNSASDGTFYLGNATLNAITIASGGNITFAGTIGSGAITSTAGISGTTGTFTGAFTSLGIDDNADATAITIASDERITMGGADGNQLTINDGGTTNSVIQFQQNDSAKAMIGWDNTSPGTLKLNATTSAFADNAHLVISSSGYVGIGTEAPGYPLEVYSETYPQIMLDGTDNSGNIGIEFEGPSGTNRGGIRWNSTNNDVEILREGGNVVMSLLDETHNVSISGSLGIGTTAPLEKLHVASGSVLVTGTGEGYAFETGAAANTLDDYEEGTFTASLTALSSAPSSVPTTTAYYTKIGDIVNVFIGFSNANTTGGSGIMAITGLPFTSHASAESFEAVALYGFAWGDDYSLAYTGGGTGTTIYFQTIDNNDIWENTAITAGSGKYMRLNMTYKV